MTENKKITIWIEWSDEDAAFTGYCPNSFRTAPFATASLRLEQSPSLLQLYGMN
jgi:hypothetical protein